MNTKNRSWSFTLFHVENEDIDQLKQNLSCANFYIFQKEEGENKTPHLQGYVQWKNPLSMAGTKKRIGWNDVHVEVAKGNKKQNIEYCSKEKGRIDGPWKEGDESGQGTRTDLNEFKCSIGDMVRKRKISMTDLVELHPDQMVKHYRFAVWYTGELLNETLGKSDFKPKEVFVLWGEPGTGKTKTAHENFSKDDIYQVSTGSGSNLWFDGYWGQKVAIIDEFNGEIPIEMLLKLLDGWPLRVQTKGGMTVWNPETVIITSQNPFHMWYKELSILRQGALERRITKQVKCIDKNEKIVLKTEIPFIEIEEETEHNSYDWEMMGASDFEL